MAGEFIDGGRLPDEQTDVRWDLSNAILAESAQRAMAADNNEALLGIPVHEQPHPADGVEVSGASATVVYLVLAVTMGSRYASSFLDSLRAVNKAFKDRDFLKNLQAAKKSLQE